MAQPVIEQIADAILDVIHDQTCTGTGQVFSAGMPAGIVDWAVPSFNEADVIMEFVDLEVIVEELGDGREEKATFLLNVVTYGIDGISPERVSMRYTESIRKLLWAARDGVTALSDMIESLECSKTNSAAPPGCLVGVVSVTVTYATEGDGYTQN